VAVEKHAISSRDITKPKALILKLTFNCGSDKED
jgi:hypothetical protein